MKKIIQEDVDIELLLRPESAIEKAILEDPDFQKGLFWGKPRFGHPEGQIVYHIQEVFENVDRMNQSPSVRAKLRLITLIHDTFKYLEDKSTHPRDWSKHHAVYARKFFEKFTDDESLLKIVELHDEAYYAWRMKYIYQDFEGSKLRLDNLLKEIGDDIQLYYLFFKCDTCTGDKNQAPMKWFERTIKGIELVSL
ncbi:MAG: HD domain-containing protein [Saprospiraceae bacterium]